MNTHQQKLFYDPFCRQREFIVDRRIYNSLYYVVIGIRGVGLERKRAIIMPE
jgi:hypothetical protein